MSKRLTITQVIKRIEYDLKHRKPLSLVRIGDGENIVLAQNSVWTMNKVMKQIWARKAQAGQKGISFPDMQLRNRLAGSIRKADIVGILPKKDRMIKAPAYLKRTLTDRVFRHFKLKPKLVCHACVNRIVTKRRDFWSMLRKQRILVITSDPYAMKAILERSPYKLNVTAALPLIHFQQIDWVLERVDDMRNDFDVALISGGVNAVILAPGIAKLTGKVAIDFGKAPKLMEKKKKNGH
ncbi:GT-D fold domain-containing glycosyltransferase [Paenibacillus arenilitoris]|uniref:GT-D fold-like domain-containing protein n=1 Tax=Paenibacillus arenilitoris TaxID=2772299 RepID=A0A927H5S3_9BACL|nr:GT-D fold domain-containing glycosyltransferase [Paenibacillus arenilitoris]MBD2869240.1 hypothetical protein [Paenibacillus arenilitoris]